MKPLLASNRSETQLFPEAVGDRIPPAWNVRYSLLLRIFLSCAITSITFQTFAAEPVTGHPRLWLRAEDLPRLRSWASDSNPVYTALVELAVEWKADMDGRPAEEGVPAQPPRVPQEDTGDWQPETYATEKYAHLFAFMSLISPEPSVREDYARRARTLLMHVMNQAVLGPAEGVPFRRAGFFTEDSNRARALGEAFPLTVDWIYPHLTAADKTTIRAVFLRWAGEIVREGYHHPEPIGVVNDPVLLSDRLNVRWSCNNYFTAFARNLGLLGMALDPSDDSGGELRKHLRAATGSWLYILDEMMKTECRGGMFAEGEEYSPASTGYLAQFMWALQTAGEDDATRWGSQVRWDANPFWNEVLPAYFNSITPGRRVNPAYDYLGPVYETASYGDQEEYFPRDRISLLGPLGLRERAAGRQDQWTAMRWAQEHLQPGGSEGVGSRVRDSNSATPGIFYFLLFDPTAAPATDMRSQFATTHFAPGIGRLLTRTGWDSNATWFTFKLSWPGIDHLNGDGNQFEFYRRGEWLTKERAGYDLDAGSSDNHNTLAVLNDDPGRDPDDYREIEWLRGSQFTYVSGDPTIKARSVNDSFVYLLGDSTALYNYPEADVTNITHVSRSIVWLKPDHVVLYDRAATLAPDRFKRFWLNLPTNAVVTANRATMKTSAGQQLFVTTLLPSGAPQVIEQNPAQPIRGDVAKGEPMTHRLRVDAPGNPREARFLHVLQGADAGAQADTTRLIEFSSGTAFNGVLAGSTVMMFPVHLDLPFNGLTYNSPAGASTHLITGLTPGASYSVTRSTTGGTETVSISIGGAEKADSGGVLTIQKTVIKNQSVFVTIPGERFQLLIASASGQPIRIEASPDLKSWISLGMAQVGTSGLLEFNETANVPATRFYRAVSP